MRPTASVKLGGLERNTEPFWALRKRKKIKISTQWPTNGTTAERRPRAAHAAGMDTTPPTETLHHAIDHLRFAMAHYNPTLLILCGCQPMSEGELRSVVAQTGAPADFVDQLQSCGLITESDDGWGLEREFREFLMAL